MHSSAIHDACANATPYQLKLADERRARQARIERRVIDAPPIVPVDKTFRAKPKPVTTSVVAEPPEPWFYLAMLTLLVQRYEGEGTPRRPRVEQIIRVVAECYNVTRDDILSARRTANIVRPRQIAMYLAKTLTIKSLPEIGRRMGRDHSTLCYGIDKIARLRAIDPDLSDELDTLTDALGGAV